MSSFQKEFGVLEPIIQGLVVSSCRSRSAHIHHRRDLEIECFFHLCYQVSIILPASALSGFMAGPVSDKISRKRTVSLGALIFAAGR